MTMIMTTTTALEYIYFFRVRRLHIASLICTHTEYSFPLIIGGSKLDNGKGNDN